MASLTYSDYLKAAHALNCEVAAIRAVAYKESGGKGFYLTGGIKKRFEAHLFLRSAKVSAGSFDAAFAINPTAALESTSWGVFQVLGSNYEKAGYRNAAEMVDSYKRNEKNQLDSYVRIIKAWGLADELRERNWNSYAYSYNGSKYPPSYPADLERYYQKYKVNPQQELVFGYTQNNTIGFTVLLFAVAGGGFYAYKKGWFKSIKFPQIPRLL